jgi:hypothetical protein
MINSDYDYTEDEVIGSNIFVYEFMTLCHRLVGIISILCWVMLQLKIVRRWLFLKCTSVQNELAKDLLEEVSILWPLGYEPNTLPLRHRALLDADNETYCNICIHTQKIHFSPTSISYTTKWHFQLETYSYCYFKLKISGFSHSFKTNEGSP